MKEKLTPILNLLTESCRAHRETRRYIKNHVRLLHSSEALKRCTDVLILPLDSPSSERCNTPARGGHDHEEPPHPSNDTFGY